MSGPLSTHGFPRAILHIDGDAFFASCEQARNPALRGKPVITGKERGIVASMSYEAKARGVTRAMRLFEVRQVCPDAVILPSDYETYSLLSKRFFAIVRRWTPDVEEYGIDECFADLTGLRRSLRMGYTDIARHIKEEADAELGFTFSAGLAPNKVVAKIASKWAKPSGFTAIPARDIHHYIAKLPVEKIWGIGHQTAAYLEKFHIRTALDFAQKSEAWVRNALTKPGITIWEELNGKCVIPLETAEKTSYASIQKVKTFTPPSADRAFVLAQLSKNIENATMKARRYRLAASGAAIFLRSQDFRMVGAEMRFSRPTAYPNEILALVTPAFNHAFRPRTLYRQTGVVLLDLRADEAIQLDLFGGGIQAEKLHHLYEKVDELRLRFGKYTLYLGSSHPANAFAQHLGERGDIPLRKETLLKGETSRRRLGIPLLVGRAAPPANALTPQV